MRRLSRNFFSIILSDIGRRLLGFFAVAYLARKLGAADFGVINIGFTVLSYAMMISAGGLTVLGTREAARGEISMLVNRVVGARLVNSTVGFFVIAFVVLLVPGAVVPKVILLFCCSLIPNAFLLD